MSRSDRQSSHEQSRDAHGVRVLIVRVSPKRRKRGHHPKIDYSATGPAIAEFLKRPKNDPFLDHLRAIGAPFYEDVRR